MPRRRRPPRAGALADLQPLRIASQLALVQALFYAAALVLMLFTALVAGMSFSLDLVLGWRAVRGDTTRGWLLALVWLLDGGLCLPLAMAVVVARSKLVPDFALSVHLVHLVCTSLYARALPRHSMWWAAMLASAGLAVALGIWGCRYRELQPVFFGAGRVLGSSTSAAAAPSSSANVPSALERGDNGASDGDDGDFARGRARGRARDGAAAEYEMEQMKLAA